MATGFKAIAMVNKKSPLVYTRRLLYFYQRQLLALCGTDRIFDVIVMHNNFFE